MSNDLFEKYEADFKAAIQEEVERRDALSLPVRRGPTANFQTASERLGEAALRRLKHNRAFALDDAGKLEFAALALACQQTKKNIVHVLEELAKDVPNLRRELPPDDAGTVPPLPIDPATGLRARNPWEEPHDFVSQNVIVQTSPRLARWLQDVARNKGVTMAMLDQLQAERIEADHLRKLEYGDTQWKQNALRPGSGATLTEQNLFIRSISDPWLLKVHRDEAKMGSPRLRFDNLTTRMDIARRSPEIRAVHAAAGEILKGWKEQAEQKERAA
jgi:hypothetical protein